MIQSAVSSISSSLPVAGGGNAATNDDAAGSGNFAALLGAKTNADTAPEQDGVIDPAATTDAAKAMQVRQAGGSLAGKKLPVGAIDLAAALTAAAKTGDGTTKEGEAAAKDGDGTETADLALPAPTTEILLPGLILPIAIAIPLPQTPQTETTVPATGDSLAQGGAAQVVRTPAASQPAIAAALAFQAAQPQVGAAQAAAAQAMAQAAAAQVGNAPAGDAAATPAVVTKADTAATISLPTAAQAAQAAQAALSPLAAATLPTGAVLPVPNPALASAGNGAKTDPAGNPVTIESIIAANQAAADVASDRPSTLATLTGTQQAPVQMNAQVTAQTAAAAKAAEKGDAAKPDTATPLAAQTAVTATPEPEMITATRLEAAKADARAAAFETPAIAATVDAPVQPALAMQDNTAFSQTVGTVNAAPTTGSVPQSGHDFAALVDRLVEAREAASPGSVSAAISHSEFGKVSLRFDQDAKGLSVAMSSADPDFAKAVQASAASSQSQSSSDNGSNTQREDAQSQQQQHAAGSAMSQQQSQAQSSASGGGDRNERGAQTQAGGTGNGRASGQESQNDTTAETRGGIYA